MAGPIRISILANGRQARQEATLTARAFGGIHSTLGKLGVATGIGVVTAGVVGLAKSAVSLEAKFGQTMSTLQAATGASGRAMDQLNAKAIKLGADTSFSASDAADAMLELAKAGISTRDILGGGVAGTLTLAAAGGTELATAATIASNAMNAFILKGKDMASIAAALAGGANASSASVESLGLGLSQVGPGARNAGLSLQETIGILSAFDSAGIKGSDAGTSLKTMLTRLIPASDAAGGALQAVGLFSKKTGSAFVKTNGEFKSAAQIAELLHDHIGKLTQAQRVQTLTQIFGSDATRAATVLMNQGAAGLRKYIAATKDQNAAQDMAKARMSGTAGALERLSGSVETAKLRLGQELAPIVQDVANGLAEKLVPATDDALDGAKRLGNALAPTARALGDVAKFVVGLPGPMKEVAIEAGIAALVLPRLAAGFATVTANVTTNIARLQQWRAEMTYSVTRTQALSSAMTRLSGAAKTAAGVGGMVALTQATHESNAGLKALELTAGGAAVGFSMGGPMGAAIGGLAGGLTGLVVHVKGVVDAYETFNQRQNAIMDAGKDAAVDYANTLDQVTGAITRQTRTSALAALQQSGLVQIGNRLGVTTRDMIDAALGNANAASRIGNAWKKTGTVLDGLQNEKLSNWLAEQGFQLRQNQAQIRANAEATKTWGQALKGVRPKVQSKLELLGYKLTRGQLNALDRQYKLTARERRIILREIGIEPTRRKIKGLQLNLKGLGNVRTSGKWAQTFVGDAGRVKRQSAQTKAILRGIGNVKPSSRWIDLFGRDLGQARGRGAKQVDALGRTIRVGSSRWKANLAPFQASVRSGIAPSFNIASSGGHQVGADLKSGIISGFAGTQSILAGQAAAAVTAAVAAARRAADAHSPSRKMAALGQDLGDGLIVGMAARHRAAEAASRELVGRVLDSARTGTRSRAAVDAYLSGGTGGQRAAGGRRGGAAVFHIYDTDGVLMGAMHGVAQAAIDDADMMTAQIARAG